MARIAKQYRIAREHKNDAKVRIIYTKLICDGVDLLEAYDRAHNAIYGHKHENKYASQYGLKEVLIIAVVAFIAMSIGG